MSHGRIARIIRHVAAALGVAVLGLSAATAQSPAGGELLVNAYTTGYQLQAASAMASDGRFVVAWTDRARDGSEDGVFAQLFDPRGRPAGSDFRVNTLTTGWQGNPVPAMAPSGDFLVAWQDGASGTILGQRYDAMGAPVGGEFQINAYSTIGQNLSGAAMAADGRFVVTWHGGASPGGDVYARVFEANGQASGPEFRVNMATGGVQLEPVVAMDARDRFVIVWYRDGTMVGQRFDAAGHRLGSEFWVSSSGRLQPFPSVAMTPGGDFVVAWNDSLQDGSGYAVVARRFDASGAPLGPDFVVNTFTAGDQLVWRSAVSVDASGGFVVLWDSEDQDGSGFGVFGQRFTTAGERLGGEFQVNEYTTGGQASSTVAGDGSGNFVAVWSLAVNGADIHGRRFGGLQPAALAVDAPGNGMVEPGESVDARPAWLNATGATQAFAGALSRISGPAGASYGISDAVGDYGEVADGAVQACTNCYGVFVSSPPVRPASHWDVTVLESISPAVQGQQKAWSLHIGGSFDDVPASSPFYRAVETLLHRRITAGCGSSLFCASSSTTRAQMAALVLAARQGPAFAPANCAAPLFNDVPASSPFCRWVEELARRGVVTGCGGGNFCPSAAVSREQMAVFVLRTLDHTLDPPPCTTPLFNDVPASSPFCRWIEELARRGVVVGCGGGNYCPTASVTREQMAVFVSATFGLTLYGP